MVFVWFAAIPVITKDLDVDVTGRYNDVVGTKRFERSFELAGGINLPKIIICVGTDGRSYKQVVKVRRFIHSVVSNFQLHLPFYFCGLVATRFVA